jgi:hypothetical protein
MNETDAPPAMQSSRMSARAGAAASASAAARLRMVVRAASVA